MPLHSDLFITLTSNRPASCFARNSTRARAHSRTGADGWQRFGCQCLTDGPLAALSVVVWSQERAQRARRLYRSPARTSRELSERARIISGSFSIDLDPGSFGFKCLCSFIRTTVWVRMHVPNFCDKTYRNKMIST
jgi:hypothetical protein